MADGGGAPSAMADIVLDPSTRRKDVEERIAAFPVANRLTHQDLQCFAYSVGYGVDLTEANMRQWMETDRLIEGEATDTPCPRHQRGWIEFMQDEELTEPVAAARSAETVPVKCGCGGARAGVMQGGVVDVRCACVIMQPTKGLVARHCATIVWNLWL